MIFIYFFGVGFDVFRLYFLTAHGAILDMNFISPVTVCDVVAADNQVLANCRDVASHVFITMFDLHVFQVSAVVAILAHVTTSYRNKGNT